MASDQTPKGSPSGNSDKAGSFRDKLNAARYGTAGAPEQITSQQTPETELLHATSEPEIPAPVNQDMSVPEGSVEFPQPQTSSQGMIEENGFMILKSKSTEDKAKDASMEDSLAKALEDFAAMEPSLETAETNLSHNAVADESLEDAIDAIITEDDSAPDIGTDFAPGSFGAFDAAPITAEDFASSAGLETADTPEMAATFNTGNTMSEISESDISDENPASMIGASMATAIKSIVFDEMTQSIDRIARQAVRDALRQA